VAIPSSTVYSAQVTATEPGSVTARFADNHAVAATETDTGVPGASHQVVIGPSATKLTLSDASSAQTYDIQLAADYLPSYGRRLTVSGASLDPGQALSVGTDQATDELLLEGSGTSQQVGLLVEQIGENGADATVHPLVPGSGAKATVSVFDWGDVEASLIYETYPSQGRTQLLILQDNPQQREALKTQLFSKLAAEVSHVADAGVRRSLQAKLDAAKQQYARGNTAAATNILGALENETRAQTGKKLSADQADRIIATAEKLTALLGVP